MSETYLNIPINGIPKFPTAADFPAVAANGAIVEALDTHTLYAYDSSIPGWVAIASPASGSNAIDGLTGDVSASGPGVVPATVNSVGGESASNVASATSLVLGTEPANTVFAGPASGPNAAPTFRDLVASDIPSLSYVTNVSASSPLSSSGGLTPNLTISQANTSTNGYLSSIDWNTFNNKQSPLTFSDSLVNTSGTVTLVNDSTPTASQYYGTNGSSVLGYYNLPPPGTGTVTSVSVVSTNGLSGSVANPSTTPAITLSTTITGILQGSGGAISAYTGGNLTDSTAGADGIIVTGGTGAVIGSGTSIAQAQSSASQSGYLSSTDWSTFNSKQPAGNYITALTGGATASGPGSAVVTLTNSAVTGQVLTGYVSGAGTISASDSILSAVEKLNGNIVALTGQYLELNGGNQMMGNIYFSSDNVYNIGNTNSNRPSGIYSLNFGAGLGSGETGRLKLGDQTSGAQLIGTSSTLEILANAKNSLYFDGNGNIAFNTDPTVASSPFFSFGVDGASVLGGYPNPGVHTQFRPGYLAVKNAIGIGTNTGETGAIQLGDYSKGNIIYGNSDGSLNLWLNNLRLLFIDNSGNWWLDQDVSGSTPAIIFNQDNYRSIGASATTFRPSNVWVANSVGIGLASGQSGTLNLGFGGAHLVGDTSGNINVTLGSSGSVNMNSKKITNLANGTNPNDAVNFSQLSGAALTFANSLVNTSGTVTLVNDSATPGASKYYGTNGSSTLGYFALPSGTSFPLQGPNETATTPTYSFSGSTSSGMFSSAGNVIDFATNGVDRWQIPASFTFKVPDITSGTSTAGNAGTISGSSQTVASATAAAGALTIQAGSANGTSSTGAGGALTLNAGTSIGGNGGAISINSGAPQSNSVAGGNGGNINIQGANANGNNTQNNSGGSISITAGNSIGSGGGGTATLSSGQGGPGTGTAGATGGTTNVTGGLGGVGSATSGNGGGINCNAGSGGNGVAGGNGGQAQLAGGTGGTGSASGGNGGAANVQGGSPGSFAGAGGGSVTIAGGGGTSTGSGGAGGNITISGGSANGDNTVNRNGGNVTINCGNSKGSAGGVNVTVTAGTGGVGTSTTGANGGQTNINGGNGGVGSATGGNGGNVTITAGVGGNSGTPGTGGDVNIAAAATTSATTYLTVSHTATVQVKSSQLQVTTSGFGLSIAHGSNCKLGTSTLSAGTVTVANTAVTANSIIFLTVQSLGTVSVPTPIAVTAKSAGTSFTITSASITDTSIIGWMIVEGI